MKCQICGNSFKTKTELDTHLKKTVCGEIDTSKPLICSFSYKTTETKDITIPLEITLRIQVEHIKSLPAQTKTGEFVRTDKAELDT